MWPSPGPLSWRAPEPCPLQVATTMYAVEDVGRAGLLDRIPHFLMSRATPGWACEETLQEQGPVTCSRARAAVTRPGECHSKRDSEDLLPARCPNSPPEYYTNQFRLPRFSPRVVVLENLYRGSRPAVSLSKAVWQTLSIMNKALDEWGTGRMETLPPLSSVPQSLQRRSIAMPSPSPLLPGARSPIFPAYKRPGSCCAFLSNPLRLYPRASPRSSAAGCSSRELDEIRGDTTQSHLSLAECRRAECVCVGVCLCVCVCEFVCVCVS